MNLEETMKRILFAALALAVVLVPIAGAQVSERLNVSLIKVLSAEC